jgi:hypothetical protein
MVIETLAATGDSVRPSADLPPNRVVFWRLRGRVGAVMGTRTSPTWQFRVGARSAPVDTASGVESDFNGDGFTDVAVGAPGANGGRGRVSVFYGGPLGVSATAGRVLEGGAVFDGFGTTIEGIGDVNGDGFADLAVAAPQAAVGGVGSIGYVTVHFGGSGGDRRCRLSGASRRRRRRLHGGCARGARRLEWRRIRGCSVGAACSTRWTSRRCCSGSPRER